MMMPYDLGVAPKSLILSGEKQLDPRKSGWLAGK